MAGRPAEVQHTKNRFDREIASARGLVRAISSVQQQVNPHGPAGLHPKHVRQVVELAFMGMVAAWETFLEDSLVRYVAGAKAKSGYKPNPKFGLASGIPHSYELLSRDPSYNPEKHYLKVSDPKWVKSSADFFFQSHPFTHIHAKSDLLLHANSIRNRVAHDSTKCRADFKATAIHFLHPLNGTLTQGFSPGALLTAKVQRHFAQQVIQAGCTHFESYARLYEDLAEKVVP